MKNNYEDLVREKRNSQKLYANNIDKLSSLSARRCSYGLIRQSKNKLIRMTISLAK
jgi:hypothetical protein